MIDWVKICKVLDIDNDMYLDLLGRRSIIIDINQYLHVYLLCSNDSRKNEDEILRSSSDNEFRFKLCNEWHIHVLVDFLCGCTIETACFKQ